MMERESKPYSQERKGANDDSGTKPEIKSSEKKMSHCKKPWIRKKDPTSTANRLKRLLNRTQVGMHPRVQQKI